MNKIYITGHTGGLGNALCNYFDQEDIELVGLSRSNGYDLEKNLPDFVQDDFMYYINNAYSGFGQTELLYQLFEKNQDRNCTIVNISSVSADGNKDYENQYAVHKSSLDKACAQLQLIDCNCKVINIKLGRMNTEMTAHRTMYPRMQPAYIAKTIGWILSQPNEILIKNITIDLMHSNRLINSQSE